MSFDVAFARCARRLRPFERVLEIPHHEVRMPRRPMTAVVARLLRGRRNGAAALFREKIDRGRCAEKLEPAVDEAPADVQAEGVAIEGRRLLQVLDIDVYQQR